MFNKVMEEQGGYKFLDVAPELLPEKPIARPMVVMEIISVNQMLKKSLKLSVK